MGTSFATNLKKLMQERGLTAKVISQATGIATSTLSEWANGRQPKLDDAVIRLARFLGVTVEFLATGESIEETMIREITDTIGDGFTTIHQGIYRLKIEKMIGKGGGDKGG